ncbi:MAG: redoxin domain-containing protein [Pirellulales bacterium]
MLTRIAILSSITILFPTVTHAKSMVGAEIANFRLPDRMGKEHALADFAAQDLVVVAFLGTECPLAKLYAVRLQAITEEYAERGVAVLAVMANVQDSLTEIAAFVERHKITYPVLKDKRNKVADLFAAERTPQVFVLDRQRTVRYQGRVDDQYLVGIVRDKPTREDLRLAIDELLSGNSVSVAETVSSGCIIGRARKPSDHSPITYTRDIAPILQSRCVECHRAGEIGPFELTSYEEAAGWGEMIAEVVREGRMPPWHADPKYGSFANNRSLPATEKERLYEWVQNGCPEGDPTDLREPRQFTAGWQLPRQPDLVLAMQEPFTVPADGGRNGVPYQYFRVPTGFSEDKWVAATEVQPGNRSVVHHTIVYIEPHGGKRRDDWIFLTAYVPGLRFDPLPAGSAKRVPAGSKLVFEMHYTPNGAEQQDTTKIGIVFADVDQIDKEVITTEIGDDQFEIPPGADSYIVTATSRPINQEATLLSMSPHMHLRGKAFRYELVLPTGEREVLLDVPAYDFSWQTRYLLAEPRPLPIGSVIHCRAVFDNSEKNLANPDPNKSVRWGDQSWEEMMLGFFDVVLARDDQRQAGKKPVKTGLDLVGMFDTADSDRNGGLSVTETSGHELIMQHFAAIDRNHDELLQLGEILAAVQALARRR